MKKLLLTLLVLTAGMAAQAQEKRDTTVIKNADKVTIVTGDSLQRIVVEGVKDNSAYYYQNTIELRDSNYVKAKCERKGKQKHSFDFDLAVGWAAPTNVPSGMSFAPFRSWEWTLGIRYKYQPKGKLQTYSVGLWFNWHRYALSTDKMFVKGSTIATTGQPVSGNAQSVVGLADYPTGASNKSSNISVFSFSVPLLFTQRFGHKCPWRLTVGPVINFNVKGRLNSEYELGDNTFDVSTKGLEYRPVTIDFMGVVKYKEIGLYFKYSPMSVLKSNMGPQFHALSFGVFL